MSTRRGVGAIVFKFKSTRDCIEFCDRLVYLNRDHFKNGKRGDVYVNGMDSREQYCDEVREAKRRRLTMMGDRQMFDTSASGASGAANVEEQSAREARRQDELLSYIVRLAHDEEFRQFVDEIERGLELAPETAGIYSAMGL